ncbi:hypothetical protein [Sphingomonas radiodurans]|uniref:hypothetical protein n=1 Tax=Sphingomonas radiodurans TaxID=2890321 RepID=UPI001E5D3402|nr:hypothetical protein [Sphingomonas radiodurans]WBH17153.1 hypothetical protein LLW23_03265 [Sphingomonas radiodurans]
MAPERLRRHDTSRRQAAGKPAQSCRLVEDRVSQPAFTAFEKQVHRPANEPMNTRA